MLSDRRRGTRQPRVGGRRRGTRESPRPAARAPDTRRGSLRMNMTGTGTIGTRQQVERWIEESQYLLGRVIPSVIDDNQRLRERAAASDAECDRMREEIATVRRELHEVQLELSGLRGQNDDLRSQQAAVAESLSRAVHHMTELMQPMNEMVTRLHVQPAVESAYQ